ncbi:hypothetical protein CEXT_233791 [Caerostris extrusa]|uniref:Ribosomal protein L5 n=1 Tax=Caerostris extrusa TaxID=172846 RepID=A0AAV4XZN9_CAEEX|nr:hypothetical protein CEXT_233791 [Caerostris extrusa]
MYVITSYNILNYIITPVKLNGIAPHKIRVNLCHYTTLYDKNKKHPGITNILSIESGDIPPPLQTDCLKFRVTPHYPITSTNLARNLFYRYLHNFLFTFRQRKRHFTSFGESKELDWTPFSERVGAQKAKQIDFGEGLKGMAARKSEGKHCIYIIFASFEKRFSLHSKGCIEFIRI